MAESELRGIIPTLRRTIRQSGWQTGNLAKAAGLEATAVDAFLAGGDLALTQAEQVAQVLDLSLYLLPAGEVAPMLPEGCLVLLRYVAGASCRTLPEVKRHLREQGVTDVAELFERLDRQRYIECASAMDGADQPGALWHSMCAPGWRSWAELVLLDEDSVCRLYVRATQRGWDAVRGKPKPQSQPLARPKVVPIVQTVSEARASRGK